MVDTQWWVTHAGGVPVGPVSTELLLRGIGAGKVPRDALVCEVGGTKWRSLRETAPFSIAVDAHRARRALDSGDEMTLADPPTSEDALDGFDDSPEQTTQTSIELPRRWFESLNEGEERTQVDILPLRPSDTPPEH